MEHAAGHLPGWIVDAKDAWVFIGGWVAMVLIYGVWRSLGQAPQDPIRPSGPTE